ncbi:MAG: hypothetical protein K2G93_08165 [Rikenella sp.]|nr:hypothetical protein [Rikenella sp.]
MRHVGRYGHSWSSTVTGSANYFMDFDFIGIYPNGDNHRALGLQTRCLQE